MNHSETLTKIAPALVAALAQVGGAKKGKTNPQFKSTYATLEAVIAASKEILFEHGLCLIQFPGACAGGIQNLETIFLHESGEWISGEMGIALGKADPQGVGSAITYQRRYAQMSALNMPAVDDDGEAAMGRVVGRERSAPPPERDFPGAEGSIGKTAYAVKTEDGGKRFNELKAEIEGLDSMTAVGLFTKERAEEIKQMPGSWRTLLREALEEQKHFIATSDPAD